MEAASGVLDKSQPSLFYYLILKVLLAVWWADWLFQSHSCLQKREAGSVSQVKLYLTITTALCWSSPVWSSGCVLYLHVTTLTPFQTMRSVKDILTLWDKPGRILFCKRKYICWQATSHDLWPFDHPCPLLVPLFKKKKVLIHHFVCFAQIVFPRL